MLMHYKTQRKLQRIPKMAASTLCALEHHILKAKPSALKNGKLCLTNTPNPVTASSQSLNEAIGTLLNPEPEPLNPKP